MKGIKKIETEKKKNDDKLVCIMKYILAHLNLHFSLPNALQCQQKDNNLNL